MYVQKMTKDLFFYLCTIKKLSLSLLHHYRIENNCIMRFVNIAINN